MVLFIKLYDILEPHIKATHTKNGLKLIFTYLKKNNIDIFKVLEKEL